MGQFAVCGGVVNVVKWMEDRKIWVLVFSLQFAMGESFGLLLGTEGTHGQLMV